MLLKRTAFFVVITLKFFIYSVNSDQISEFIRMVEHNVSVIESTDGLPTENVEVKNLDDTEDITDLGNFDFIIVGGGSAGTLLTNRLSEIGHWKILLLEAGGDQTEFSEIPGMAPLLQDTELSWGYFTTSQNTCCLGMRKQQCIAPRGKVLGGSSTINAKMYVRANKADYEYWQKLGNRGWSYEHVLPYFIKTENSTIGNGDPGYHGTNGLLHVQYNEPSEFTSRFLCAQHELGVPILDYNGENQIGASPIQFTIDGIKIASGRRAFIEPILNKRKNVKIILKAFVTKVIIDHNKIARYVEFVKDKKKYIVGANKEIILSAGAYNTPQILMLSGIGPRDELEKHDIKVIQNLPVGEYLQEHPLFLGFIIRTNQTIPTKTLKQNLISYLLGHRPLTTPMNLDCTVFTKLSANSSSSDIQSFLVVPPGYGDRLGHVFNFNSKITNSIKNNYQTTTDLIILIVLLRPESKGTVKLKSNNPKDFPLIDYKLFSDPDYIDIDTMYRGIINNFDLLDTKAFQGLNATFVPIDAGCGPFKKHSKPYWYCMIRHMTTTIYHPMGTARMGISLENSVVSNHLRVHGVTNLRVIDASVMPSMPSGNLNAVVYMIAERAADLIKKHYNVYSP